MRKLFFKIQAMQKPNCSHAWREGLITRDQFRVGAWAQHASGKTIGHRVAGHLLIAL